ncbi:hypothetical protein C10C_0640 [Chlamydia serpentis]|uniref:Uncharacterized protein n=1 Tax=Chlamydia serpentis TaxID=1967782 RepID=A0A2R8FBJ3_9CHLA|nr:hypothetical protein [Chlamydia serpentis]SPN73794.1 hypothetical protein C10C_0640 [Chlamydia serpentis]
MILDFQFSIGYYLRVLELAIRDSTRILAYDKKRLLLDAWSVNDPLPPNYDVSLTTIRQVIHELFSYLAISYSISSRLLAIIELRLHEEQAATGWFYRWFFPSIYVTKKAVVDKLYMLKSLILFESKRPLDKITRAANQVFSKGKSNFSSWEDFTYEVRIAEDQIPLTEKVRGSLIAETSLQMMLEALTTLLEGHTSYLPLSLELINQFVEDKAKPLITLSVKSHLLLSELIQLFFLSPEDFQTIIIGIISDSLSDTLADSLIGNQPLTSDGKTFLGLWQEVAITSPQDSQLALEFLAEVLRKVIAEKILYLSKSEQSTTPEEVGTIYGIRDQDPTLWNKMIKTLLMRWLLDYDKDVRKALQKATEYYNPQPSFWRQFWRLWQRCP